LYNASAQLSYTVCVCDTNIAIPSVCQTIQLSVCYNCYVLKREPVIKQSALDDSPRGLVFQPQMLMKF